MKLPSIILLFFISHLVNAQSDLEQDLYGHKIWKAVENGRGVVEFLDVNDLVLGTKKVSNSDVKYYDTRRRVIKRISIQSNNNTKPSKKVKRKDSLKGKVKVGNLYVKSKRNRSYYYNSDGVLIRKVRKKGNKIYYKDSKGKLLGYKEIKGNGKLEYRDVRGRKTGESFLNQSGFVVYTSYRNRTTPSYMVSDIYFL